MKPKRRLVGPIAFTVATMMATASVLAFVPSAKKELSALYPPILRGDLSACSAKAAVAPTATAARSKFVQRLQGTWELKSRTVQGITVNSSERLARLYFDLIAPVGAALLIDRSRSVSDADLSPGDQAIAAFWTVGVAQRDKQLVALTMRGESVGSYIYARVRNLEDSRFFEHKNVFVAIDKESPGAIGWDKIVLTEKSMTYVSCEQGIVELYAKVSNRQPLVAGLTLQDSWERIRTRTKVAAAELWPIQRTWERGQ